MALKIIKQPGSRPMGIVLPRPEDGGQGYQTIGANTYLNRDDMLGTALDTAQWADGSSLGTGAGAAPTVGSNFVSLIVPTSTAGTTTIRVRSAHSSGANIYNVPFRVAFDARVSTTAGAGVAPTGGLDVYLGVRDTGDTHIAQFRLDLTTASSSSLAAPILHMETRQGSTAAAFINSSAAQIFATAASRTATGVMSYMLEVTHRGVAFGTREQNGVGQYQLLGYFGSKVPDLEKNYYVDMRIVADGTAGYTQTAGVTLEVDSVTVEQLGFNFDPLVQGMGAMVRNQMKTAFVTQALGSAAGGLVTSGTGVLYGASVGSTGTTGVDNFLAIWDASAAGSAVYDFSTLTSSLARLIYYAQVSGAGSAGADLGMSQPIVMPKDGLPFFRGLVVGAVTAAATAIGNSALNVLTMYKVS